jgi:hypothetical protein
LTASSTTASAQIATTAIQDVRATSMRSMFADVAVEGASSADAPQAGGLSARAERLIGRVEELSRDLRCVALFESGRLLAASCEGEWEELGTELWAAAEEAHPDAEQVHVGGPDGELFALRAGPLSAIAASERFTLASLMFCDLRAILRELAAAEAGR